MQGAKFDKSAKGRIYIPKDSNAVIYSTEYIDGKYRSVSSSSAWDNETGSPKYYYEGTGYYLQFSNGSYGFQIYSGNNTDSEWAVIFSTDNWSVTDYVSKSNAQNLINEIVANNIAILRNQVLCTKIVAKLSELNITVDSSLGQRMADLQRRLDKRNSVLANQNMFNIQSVQTQNIADAQSLAFLNAIMQKYPAISAVLSTTAIIIITLVITASVGTAVWAIYSKYHPESKQDIKYSDDLVSSLKKYLPADVYVQLEKENAANAKKFNQLIDNASGQGILKTVSYVGAGLIGFFLIKKFILDKA